VLSPLLQATGSSFDGSVGDVVALTLEAAIPFGLAASGIVSTEAITLWGGELVVREREHGTDGALLFDIEVDLSVDVSINGTSLIHCTPDRPIRVRYKAVGFRLNFGSDRTNPVFQPMFDSSKGYTIDVSDPGMFQLPDPLGRILQVLGARIARTNPLNLELDVGIAADLGVVSVDRLKVRVPLDQMPPIPTVTGLGVGVDIPGALTGRGYLSFENNGLAGQLDLMVGGFLRVPAGLAVQHVTQGGSSATAVLATIGVELKVPLVLGNSGLGLYGVDGLFAMHFHRAEDPRAAVPALDWYQKTNGDPSQPRFWEPLLDHWSFGVGTVLGTLEGAFILNMKGMLVLELPGPRLLFFMNTGILSDRPATKGLDGGGGRILSVVDYDIGKQTLSVGMSVTYEVPLLIKIAASATAFFNFRNAQDFYLDIGTVKAPATAKLFLFFKGDGYLMIHGNGLPDFPLKGFEHGLCVGVGFDASLIWGAEDIGLYLKISAGLHVGLSFAPLRLVGTIHVAGQIHLFVVDVEGHTDLSVEADKDKCYFDGEVCGSVDFFFFSVSACVHMRLGDSKPATPKAPPLVRGMHLQSRSPALALGTGVDRPIDGSLCDATGDGSVPGLANPDGTRSDVLVPIDSIPVLQLELPPVVGSSFGASSFCRAPSGQAPGLPTDKDNQHKIWRGNLYYQYTLNSIAISPPLPSGGGDVPSVWRSRSAQPDAATAALELALLDWNPEATPKAAPRSLQRDEQVTRRWGTLCTPSAPAASVLFTFERSAVGPSGKGWILDGVPWPDPPNARRSSPPPTRLRVTEAWRTGAPLADSLCSADPARVIEEPVTGPPPATGPDSALSRVLRAPFLSGQRPAPRASAAYNDLVNFVWRAVPARDTLGDALFLECGPITHIRLLLLVPRPLLQAGLMVLRPLGADDKTLGDQVIGRAPGDYDSLPASWRDASGPWYSDAWLAAWQLVRDRAGTTGNPESYDPVLYDADVPSSAVRFELGILRLESVVGSYGQLGLLPPSFVLGAVETFSVGESIRNDWDEGARKSEITTLQQALAADRAKQALLAPNTVYTITINYDVEVGDHSATIDRSPGLTQSFTFKTDGKAPARLDPWVLGTNPSPDEGFHFWGDPIIVVFNTNDVEQLFRAYGKGLQGVVRASSFRPLPSDPRRAQTLSAIAQASGTLQSVAGVLLSPWEERIRQLVAEQLPCVDASMQMNRHSISTLNLLLEPLTEYTFDVETYEPSGGPILRLPPPPSDGSPAKPLYRTAFTTSRYRDAQSMAADIATSRVGSRAVASGTAVRLANLPAEPTDRQLEQALRDCGLGGHEPPTAPELTVLWEQGAPARPIALWVDTPEPLWRFRSAPQPHLDPLDNQRTLWWALQRTLWLYPDVDDSAPAIVARWVRSPGGGRTLALLSTDARGQRLKLVLRKTTDRLLDAGQPFAPVPLLDITLVQAPWEDPS
jgi:hypothetical protein